MSMIRYRNVQKGKKQHVNDDWKSSGSHSGGNSPDLLALQ